MQNFETTMEDTEKQADFFSERKEQAVDLLLRIVKKVVLFICFGPGVLGLLWLVGRIFKR